MTFRLNWRVIALTDILYKRIWHLSRCEKERINHSLPPLPEQDFNTCAVCCFLHEVNSLIRFSLITDSVSSFDAELCSLSLSLLLCFLCPLLFFQTSEDKVKTSICFAAALTSLPFSLNQKSELRCATDDLPQPPAKRSASFRPSLMTLHLKATSSSNIQYILWCSQFVCSLIALCPDWSTF